MILIHPDLCRISQSTKIMESVTYLPDANGNLIREDNNIVPPKCCHNVSCKQRDRYHGESAISSQHSLWKQLGIHSTRRCKEGHKLVLNLVDPHKSSNQSIDSKRADSRSREHVYSTGCHSDIHSDVHEDHRVSSRLPTSESTMFGHQELDHILKFLNDIDHEDIPRDYKVQRVIDASFGICYRMEQSSIQQKEKISLLRGYLEELRERQRHCS